MQHSIRMYNPNITRTDGWVNALVFLVIMAMCGVIAGPILIFSVGMATLGTLVGVGPAVLTAAHITLALTHAAEKMKASQYNAWDFYQKMPAVPKAELGKVSIDTFSNMSDEDANSVLNKMRSLVAVYNSNQEACKVEDARVLSLKSNLDDRIDYYQSHTKELKARA